MKVMSNASRGAVIFDMDGVIIDSEPYWQKAEVEAFGRVAVPLTVEMCKQTTGLRMDAAVEYWFARYPWVGVGKNEIEQQVKLRVKELLHETARPMRGAVSLVRALAHDGIPLAVCSSSPLFLIEAVCARLGIDNCISVLQSAEDCTYGKPHPEPYLTTARRLDIQPERCVVLEDSMNGMISGKAARMKVIAIPSGGLATSTRYDFCDLRTESLLNLSPATILGLLSNAG